MNYLKWKTPSSFELSYNSGTNFFIKLEKDFVLLTPLLLISSGIYSDIQPPGLGSLFWTKLVTDLIFYEIF